MREVMMADPWYRSSFSSTAFVRYRLPEFKDKYYTLIIFGKCNMRCSFCFSGGSEKNLKNQLPGARAVEFEEVIEKVIEQVKNNEIIRISGGEPTLFPKEVKDILKAIKENGGYSILDTNGTNFNVLKELSKYIDVLSIDGPKASLNNIEILTGTRKEISWYKPLETLYNAKKLSYRVLEYKNVLFDPINYNHIRFLAENIPEESILTLKSYRETKEVKNDGGFKREIISNGFKKPNKEEVYKTAEKLIRDFPSLRGRLLVIYGSTRRKENYKWFK